MRTDEKAEMSSSSPPTSIQRPQGQQRALSGLRREPDVFGTSLPTPSGPIKNFQTALPTSREESRRRAIKVTDGKGGTMNSIVADIIPSLWDEGYHLHLFEGQPMFVLKNNDPMSHPITTDMLNLRQVNDIYGNAFDLAMDMLTSGEVSKARYLTPTQVTKLWQTPTHGWFSLPFVRAMLDDSTKTAFHTIRYLFQEGIRDRFNFLGFARGQMSEDLPKKVTAVAVMGSLDSVENVWGDQVRSGEMLFFIFKQRHLGGGRYGGFAYHPWYGVDPPTFQDIVYRDVTGTLRLGQVIFVGTIDRWVEEETISMSRLLESTGFKPPDSERVYSRPEPGCIRIHRSSRTGFRGIPWYY